MCSELRCPRCKEKDVMDSGNPEHCTDTEVVHYFVCNDCDLEFYAVFELSGIEDYED